MDYLGSEAAAIQPSFRFFAEQIYQATDEEVPVLLPLHVAKFFGGSSESQGKICKITMC